MILLLAFAFLAGIVTILSPCILPILPIILSSSVDSSGKKRPLGVVTGFIASFTFFTLFLSTIVKLSGIPAETLRFASIIILIIFGLSLLTPRVQLITEQLFSKLAKFVPRQKSRSGFFGGLLIGFSVGLLWTPCVGPILASVISLAITGSISSQALLITLAYSAGTAIPMFIIILAGSTALKKVPWLLKNTARIQKAFGILMIATAIGIYFNVDRRFQTFILETFPNYGVGLTKFEDNELIKKQLEDINTKPQNQDLIGKPMNISEDLGPIAPEIIPGGIWFNSQPLTLSELKSKGKVVLIDFWTYSCINCQRTLPYLRSWHEKYQNQGLVIIGVHSPEFEFEKDKDNVASAIEDFELKYPIVQDNDFATWRTYGNRYWPAKYLIDKNGRIRYHHFGEGKYQETEMEIQKLLKETGVQESAGLTILEEQTPRGPLTPETYLGTLRLDRFASSQKTANGKKSYTISQNIPEDYFSLGGAWTLADEYAQSQKGSALELNFFADKVFLVVTPKTHSDQIKIFLDGKIVDDAVGGSEVKNGIVTATEAKLYNLIDLKGKKGNHILRLEFQTEGTQIYAFTFG